MAWWCQCLLLVDVSALPPCAYLISLLSLSGGMCRMTPLFRSSQANRLLAICWLHPPRRGPCVWIHWSCCGICDRVCGRLGTSSSLCILRVADRSMQCVRAYVFESKVFVTMVLILIFGEVLGLYGYVIFGPLSRISTRLTRPPS